MICVRIQCDGCGEEVVFEGETSSRRCPNCWLHLAIRRCVECGDIVGFQDRCADCLTRARSGGLELTSMQLMRREAMGRELLKIARELED